MQIPRSLGTHDGTFHADEVTASALLVHYGLVDKEKIIRTRFKQKLDQCAFVCDVGGEYDPEKKRFDHHQVSYQGGLSSAGMVWAYLRDRGIVDAKTYVFLNQSLIIGVDAHDNGKVLAELGVCTFSQIISNFSPISYEASDEERDEAFFLALDFVLSHLKRLFDRFSYVHQCEAKVRDAMQKGKEFLFFEESLPWIDPFFEQGGEQHPAQFVVMPAKDHWKVRGIPPTSDERMQVRKPLPFSWAGLLDEELKQVSGIEGAVFCHKGRFVSVWETKEDALRALNYALKEGV